MNQDRHLGRRAFLRRSALTGLAAGGGIAGAGGLLSAAGASIPTLAQRLVAAQSAPGVPATITNVHRLMTTDGFISLPGRHWDPDPLLNNGVYSFGFREVDDPVTESDDPIATLITNYKGAVYHTSPTLWFPEGEEGAIVVSNLGFVERPDLDDAHSLHWHGFRNTTAVFDGVPEASASVPSGRDFPYYYNMAAYNPPSDPLGSAGTYMYHCHFEDVEHVQMGMTGIIFVVPQQNMVDGKKRCYNDIGGPEPTTFDREWALLFNEIDVVPHDNLLAVQGFVWSDYKPQYWTINGRSYPDTVLGNIQPGTVPAGAAAHLEFQPNSSLVQVSESETGLLRLANLGYEVHSIEVPGLPLRVVGGDATYLGANSYTTSHIDLGPGEARDVIFTAPPYDATPANVHTDTEGNYNLYLLRSRNAHRNTNGGDPGLAAPNGLGGMVTEIRVYQAESLPPQTVPNETYPTWEA